MSGSNSVVESRLPKPLVAGSIPVSRSRITGLAKFQTDGFIQEREIHRFLNQRGVS